MNTGYTLLPELFLRAPYYSYNHYDPERLEEVLQDPPFRNAIWLASPALYQELQRKDFDYHGLSPKEQFSLLKYYNRMCFRPTPFGGFASFSIGKWSEGETIGLSKDEQAYFHCLPDLQWLNKQAAAAGSGLAARTLVLNPTLYRLGGEYRFVKSAEGRTGKSDFGIEAISANPFHIAMISFCRKTSIRGGDLTSWIQQHSACPQEEAGQYLDFLVEAQVLFPDRLSSMIGGEAGRLIGFPAPFRDLWKSFHCFSLKQAGTLSEIAPEIQASLGAPAAATEIPIFYSALERKWLKGGPSPAEAGEIEAAANVLHRFSPIGAPAALVRFTEGFRARFDRRKIPLLEALDPDAGIVYGPAAIAAEETGTLSRIRFPAAQEPPQTVSWTDEHRLLFQRWTEAKTQGPFAAITLHPPDRGDALRQVPSTMAIMFRKTGEHLVIDYAGGASATALIGRFSAFSHEALNLCRKLAALESAANPAVIFADIDQRSHLHSDNINRREKIYDYRIAINSFAAGKGTIALDDLQLSVTGDELLLESVSLGKQVVPRLSTAYNYQLTGLGIFRLFCDLQYQGTSAIRPFNLEYFFPGLQFYPRVVSGQVILALAKWKFTAGDFVNLLKVPQAELQRRFRQFRKENNLPLKVSLGDTDQQLVFDLSGEAETQFFIECIRNKIDITLHEYLEPAKCVKTGNKPLAGQFIAFLAHNRVVYPGTKNITIPVSGHGQRDFLPGDEWLYLKVYCTPPAADQLLSDVLPLFVERQQKELLCWFFIRYDDAGNHLRLRFKAQLKSVGQLLTDFLAVLRFTGTDHLISKYTADTYQRELERYPEALIGKIEDTFCEGSAYVCGRLAGSGVNDGPEAEFLFGLVIADSLLSIFLQGGERRVFCKTVVENFTNEFNGGKSLKIDMDNAYRNLKAEISKALSVKKPSLPKAAALAEASSNMPPPERKRLIADIVHMQMNRNFQVRGRQQEFLVYHCLLKHYSSADARFAQLK